MSPAAGPRWFGPLVPAALVLVAAGCGQRPAEPAAADPLTFLSGPETAGFERADQPRAFSFPRDHGSHLRFRTEWWYLTGNLQAVDTGQPYGFQLTIFRFALAPGPGLPGWRARHLWLGQLAISDLAEQRFLAAERVSRGIEGVAGAARHGLEVRVEDWLLQGDDALAAVRLTAPDPEAGLALELSALRAPVLQGEDGLSRKGSEPGNASYYYSVPRLSVSGELLLAGEPVPVTGLAWLDREWSTSALEADQAGWDWFALQLANGTDVMVYRLRTTAGTMHPASAGVIVRPDGTERHFDADALTLVPQRYWTSTETGRRYPVGWRVALGGLDLTVASRLDRQEHTGRFEYWEGAVTASGEQAGRPVQGVGYLEMTGYE